MARAQARRVGATAERRSAHRGLAIGLGHLAGLHEIYLVMRRLAAAVGSGGWRAGEGLVSLTMQMHCRRRTMYPGGAARGGGVVEPLPFRALVVVRNPLSQGQGRRHPGRATLATPCVQGLMQPGPASAVACMRQGRPTQTHTRRWT
jgi:hypothetical protein